MKQSTIGIVILAAGKGTRLGCTDIPKVMLDLEGKPIVAYIVETLESLGYTKEQICMVVGFCKEKVLEYFGDRVSYAHQQEQKGTAHAAYTGIVTLPKHIEHVLIIQGDDSAFYTKETIATFIEEHICKAMTVSLLSAIVDDPSQLGRIVRNGDGTIEIIEKEYVTEEQKQIHEISTGTFCVNRAWFEHMFPTMPQLKKLGEYGLPTAMSMVRQEQLPYQVVQMVHANEWFGVNTKEQLEEAKQRKQQLHKI